MVYSDEALKSTAEPSGGGAGEPGDGPGSDSGGEERPARVPTRTILLTFASVAAAALYCALNMLR
jgi:hypothetical protein